MKEWTEEEIRDRNLMGPCGLFCGACGVYVATRDGNEELRKIMATTYGATPEETECLGCMQSDSSKKLFGFCAECDLRGCAKSKGYYSCHQCEEFPCSRIESFPFGPGRKIMKDSISKWRDKVAEHGDEKGCIEWARQECGRYRCSSCGEPHIRGAQTCDACKQTATEDGWISLQAKQIELDR
ncbi:MAG: DUF3795 domain-containing protein [Deltaproteobacteria bacterium]|nr:DUF3795 domain-containing protein [Deltaproteobacteria bacterium]